MALEVGALVEEGTCTVSIDRMVSPSTLRIIWQARASSELCKNALTRYFSLLNDEHSEPCRGYSPNFHASEVHVSSCLWRTPSTFFYTMHISFFSQAAATIENGKRILFQFDRAAFSFKFLPFKVPYPVPFKLLGDEAKGWLDTTYLSPSGNLRISRGNKVYMNFIILSVPNSVFML